MEMTALLMGSLLHRSLFFFFFFFLHVFLLYSSSAFPLCTNSRAPISLKAPLAFCSYNGSSCCNATDDDELQKQFRSMNISDSDCASVVKSILCTKCDPYSSDLFTIFTKARKIPVLCKNTTNSIRDPSTDFCNKVWSTCKDISIHNSPFSAAASASEKANSSAPTPSSKLTDQWNSSTEFCKAMGGSAPAGSICFDGASVSFESAADSSPPQGICVEKIGNGSFLSMEPHPDGSNRAFLSNQAGLIWLASVPDQESGGTLDLNQSNIFLDLTDMVYSDTQFGVMGLAFHPDFTENGRFFLSFNCDKVKMASCSGRCACNSQVGCDPSKLGLEDGDQHCRYQSVVSEFTVNGSSSKPSEATSAVPSEVRRIFTMGLPYNSHHAGQILFGPEDGYLYFMMGDGGNKGDPFNFAQNKKSVLGKIMRLDVNQIPSSKEITDLDLWGNYSIPKDNPSNTDDGELLPEIWALGLRNPWRCSFDSKRPSYFFCADVGEETYEEINLISKGGNYGWRVYEGSSIFHPSWTPGGNTSANSINQIWPVMGYNHSSVNNNVGSASITGGYVYRSNTDPCLNGRFVYADLYGGEMWAGTENPQGSGIYGTAKLPFSCAADSPIPCEPIGGSAAVPSLGILYSFAADNAGELYVLASKGVFRIVRPSRCDYACASESHTDTAAPPPAASSSPATIRPQLVMLLLGSFFVLFASF